ncbi:MAG: hypothetical protein ACJ790_18515 [Myxococcaceae bacterium]
MLKTAAVLLCLVALPAVASEAPLKSTYDLQFKVTDADGKKVILESSAAIEMRWSQKFSANAQGTADAVEVTVSATPAEDGTVVLRFDWSEAGAEGRRLVWSPRLAMARNSSGTAKVRWGNDGRTLEVKLK